MFSKDNSLLILHRKDYTALTFENISQEEQKVFWEQVRLEKECTRMEKRQYATLDPSDPSSVSLAHAHTHVNRCTHTNECVLVFACMCICVCVSVCMGV